MIFPSTDIGSNITVSTVPGDGGDNGGSGGTSDPGGGTPGGGDGIITSPPTAVCQDITIALDGTGNASITGSDIDGGSYTNVSDPSYTATAIPNAFTCSDVGPNNVYLIITDVYGKKDSCIAIVTVSGSAPDDSFTISDDGACVPGTFTLTMSSSEVGVSYQLRLDSDDSNVGAPIAGTGSPISFTVTPLVSTRYNVYATGASCALEMLDKPKVVITSNPAVGIIYGTPIQPPSFTENVVSTNADEANSVYAMDVDSDGDIDFLSA